jgi:hypothetical protein
LVTTPPSVLQQMPLGIGQPRESVWRDRLLLGMRSSRHGQPAGYRSGYRFSSCDRHCTILHSGRLRLTPATVGW